MANQLVTVDGGQRVGLDGSATGQVPTWDQGASAWSALAVPYDISGEAAATPDASTVIWHFKYGRAATLKASGHVAGCDVAPSGGSPSFPITKITAAGASSQIGTLDFADDATTGTVTITGAADVTFAIGDRITLTTSDNLYAMEAPFWTFLQTCP